jgi:hypothetical protein
MGEACIVACGEDEYKILVLMVEGKMLIRIPKCKWEDNIKIYILKVGLEEWIGLMSIGVGISGSVCNSLRVS